MLKISAIVCTYNRERFLPKALESLASQTLPFSNFEVIIVNNNSTDSTHEICNSYHKKYPDIAFKYVIEEKQGLSFARNRGYVEANAELVTYIDDDAWLDKNFLKEVVGFLTINPEIVAVGGKILLDYEKQAPVWMSKYLTSLLGYFVYSEKIVPFKKNSYPRGSNMTFRKNILIEINGFNTELGRIGKNLGGGEEKDIFQRIYEKGLIVYNLPTAVVYHAVPVERTSVEFIRRQAIGIGQSEKIRVGNNKRLYINRLWQELYKWCATIILFLIYSFEFKWGKAKMIVKFRWWISLGLINGS